MEQTFASLDRDPFSSVECGQWDYRARIKSQTELITKLRSTLDTVLKQKQLFKDACMDTESALKVHCILNVDGIFVCSFRVVLIKVIQPLVFHT